MPTLDKELGLLKTCKRCNVQKPLSAFAKCRARIDGHSHKCKICVAETRPSRAGSKVSRAYWAKWYAENKPEVLARQKASPERRERARQRYEMNCAGIRAAQRLRDARPEAKVLHAAAQRRRMRRIADATPKWLDSERRAEIDYIYWHARDVTAIVGERYHVDHIVPLQGKRVCGLHVPWNLRVVPAVVNQRKHANLEDF